jgi:S-DNA-T family DNA segregation ATPase FtsK/SpoIIIE
MEQRYERYAKETVRNIEGYNEKMAERGCEKDYYIVVIIDELADLMLVASNDVEDSIQRLAQMARAVGIHLILTTQRPSVNVITGVIKANFPARIAFQTTSKVDSRVILDTIGADALLGKGDMLFMPPGESRCSRLQGAFVSVKEAEKVIQFIAQQNFPRQYEPLAVRTGGNGTDDFNPEEADRSMKELLSALKLMQERKRISQDLLKAHFGSSARATNLLSLLETKGFIHKPEGTNRWTIHYDLISEYIAAMGGNTGDDSEAGKLVQRQTSAEPKPSPAVAPASTVQSRARRAVHTRSLRPEFSSSSPSNARSALPAAVQWRGSGAPKGDASRTARSGSTTSIGTIAPRRSIATYTVSRA